MLRCTGVGRRPCVSASLVDNQQVVGSPCLDAMGLPRLTDMAFSTLVTSLCLLIIILTMAASSSSCSHSHPPSPPLLPLPSPIAFNHPNIICAELPSSASLPTSPQNYTTYTAPEGMRVENLPRYRDNFVHGRRYVYNGEMWKPNRAVKCLSCHVHMAVNALQLHAMICPAVNLDIVRCHNCGLQCKRKEHNWLFDQQGLAHCLNCIRRIFGSLPIVVHVPQSAPPSPTPPPSPVRHEGQPRVPLPCGVI